MQRHRQAARSIPGSDPRYTGTSTGVRLARFSWPHFLLARRRLDAIRARERRDGHRSQLDRLRVLRRGSPARRLRCAGLIEAARINPDKWPCSVPRLPWSPARDSLPRRSVRRSRRRTCAAGNATERRTRCSSIRHVPNARSICRTAVPAVHPARALGNECQTGDYCLAFSDGAKQPCRSPLKYSIVIATYHRAADLRETLKSLAGLQPDGPWEVIVVDNNSPDDTRAVVREAAASFPARCVPLRTRAGPEPGAQPRHPRRGRRDHRNDR